VVIAMIVAIIVSLSGNGEDQGAESRGPEHESTKRSHI
jgi:hypothetical protein